MARYIDADEAKDSMLSAMVGTGYQSRAMDVIEYTSTADVSELKHGEWELEHETYGNMVCSVCRKQCPKERKPDPYEDYQMTDFYVESPYCPNCGAKMDKGEVK